MTPKHTPHPQFDLVLERLVDVPRDLVWAAWTTPQHLKKWFTPLPWQTVDCEIDLRPGGIFRTVMRSPEGKDFPNLGCYLEIIPQEKLIWTNALFPGYRPATQAEDNCFNGFFTAIISLETQGKGTKYTATCIHGNEKDAKAHADLGFYDGWGTALDQLVKTIQEM